MNLLQVLKLIGTNKVVLVGAGGKTSAMQYICRNAPGRAWGSTTTHLGIDQVDFTDRHIQVDTNSGVSVHDLESARSILVTGQATNDGRFDAPPIEILEFMAGKTRDYQAILVVEGDGSRTRPLKAPSGHEPVIPGWADIVVVVAGLSVLHKPLTDEWTHRPEIISNITETGIDEPVEIDAIVKLLIHPKGGLKGIPIGCKKISLLNQADNEELVKIGKRSAEALLAGGYNGVFITSLKEHPEHGIWIS